MGGQGPLPKGNAPCGIGAANSRRTFNGFVEAAEALESGGQGDVGDRFGRGDEEPPGV